LPLLRCRKNTACQAPAPKEHKIPDALTDQSFIRTHRDGRQAAKRQLLDKSGSVKLNINLKHSLPNGGMDEKIWFFEKQ